MTEILEGKRIAAEEEEGGEFAGKHWTSIPRKGGRRFAKKRLKKRTALLEERILGTIP